MSMTISVTGHPWQDMDTEIDVHGFECGTFVRVGDIGHAMEMFFTDAQAAALRDALTAHLESVGATAPEPTQQAFAGSDALCTAIGCTLLAGHQEHHAGPGWGESLAPIPDPFDEEF